MLLFEHFQLFIALNLNSFLNCTPLKWFILRTTFIYHFILNKLIKREVFIVAAKKQKHVQKQVQNKKESQNIHKNQDVNEKSIENTVKNVKQNLSQILLSMMSLGKSMTLFTLMMKRNYAMQKRKKVYYFLF